jgi:hypothetical protein
MKVLGCVAKVCLGCDCFGVFVGFVWMLVFIGWFVELSSWVKF